MGSSLSEMEEMREGYFGLHKNMSVVRIRLQVISDVYNGISPINKRL